MADILPSYFEKKNNGFGTTKRFVPDQPLGIGKVRPGPGNYNIKEKGISSVVDNFNTGRMSEPLNPKGYTTDLKQQRGVLRKYRSVVKHSKDIPKTNINNML